jgi:hypothetical protein
MKKLFKNGKIIIEEELINMMDDKLEFSTIYN